MHHSVRGGREHGRRPVDVRPQGHDHHRGQDRQDHPFPRLQHRAWRGLGHDHVHEDEGSAVVHAMPGWGHRGGRPARGQRRAQFPDGVQDRCRVGRNCCDVRAHLRPALRPGRVRAVRV
ncbi:unnamed protein product [Ectocarpus sp. 12 AP-2014]